MAIARAYAQSMAGKSKDRQALADVALPFEVRILPVALSGDFDLVKRLFEPLGYTLSLPDQADDDVIALQVAATIRLADLLNHLYVLIPVLDNFKHYYVSEEEIDKLLAPVADEHGTCTA